MRYCLDGVANFGFGRALATLACIALPLIVSACTSIEEGVPPASNVPALSGSAPKDTGTYPNLNIRPTAATTQLTQEQRDAALANLEASKARAQSRAGGTAISAAEQARLRRLAQTHADDTLAEIANQ